MTRASDRAPVDGARVIGYGDTWEARIDTRTDVAGRWRAEGLAPGDLFLQFIPEREISENREITHRILQLLGKPESLIKRVADRVGHDRRYSVDTSKLERLGFKMTTDFDAALERTVQWYVANEPWWRAIKERSAEFKAYYEKQYAGR